MNESKQKLINILTKHACSTLSILDKGELPKNKTIKLDDIIGQVFGREQIYLHLKTYINTLSENREHVDIIWGRDKNSIKVKFHNPEWFLNDINFEKPDDYLKDVQAKLNFCSTSLSIMFRDNLEYRHCNSDKKYELVMIAAQFLDFVSKDDYDPVDIRTLSATLFTQKDGSKVLEQKLTSIKKIIKDVLELSDEEVESLFVFTRFEHPIYVFGDVSIYRKDLHIKNIQKPYLPLLPSYIKDTSPRCNKLITIENRTTFHLWSDFQIKKDIKDIIVVYSNGFPSRDIIMFLRHVIKENNLEEFYHFGDIDNGGFNIRHHLENKTNVPVKNIIWDESLIKQHGAYYDYGKKKPRNSLESYAMKNKFRVEQEKIILSDLNDIIIKSLN